MHARAIAPLAAGFVLIASCTVSGTTPSPRPTTDASPTPSARQLDDALVSCGSSMAGQNSVIGSFEASTPSVLYRRLPHLVAVPELAGVPGPLDVVLFGPGDFVYPLPVMWVPGSSPSPHVNTMLCIVRNGRPAFYQDVDFSGWGPLIAALRPPSPSERH
jgi:hypothetical protein